MNSSNSCRASSMSKQRALFSYSSGLEPWSSTLSPDTSCHQTVITSDDDGSWPTAIVIAPPLPIAFAAWGLKFSKFMRKEFKELERKAVYAHA